MPDGATHLVDICDEKDVRVGHYRCFDVEGVAILLCNVGGRFHAIANRCTHMNIPLEGGRQMGSNFICPHHGARFDIPTGKALSGAAVLKLATYGVHIRDGRILLELPGNG